MTRANLLILPLLFTFLSACERGTPPAQFWEFTVQGAYSAALSPDTRNLVVGSIHHGGSFWQIQKFERLFNWNHRDGESTNVLATSFSPEGKYAVTTDNRTLVLWNTSTGDPSWFWNAPGDIRDIQLTNEGDFALIGMDDYTAVLFNIKDGGILRTLPHQGIVQAVDILADSSLAITGSDDSHVRIWDMTTGKLMHNLEQDNQVKVVALSQDGKLAFSSAHRGNTAIWDIQSGQPLIQLPIISGHYSSAKFSADRSQLLTGNSSGLVQLWNVETGQNLGTWSATPKDTWVSNNVYVLDVAFGDDGYYAVGANGRVYQYTLVNKL